MAATDETIMNPRELFWLSGLAVVLAIACVADGLFSSGADKTLGQAERLFPKLTAGSIDSFAVIRGDTTVTVKKINGQWRVADPDYPAHPERIALLAKRLAELTVSQRVAETEWTETGNEKTFGLDEAKALVSWSSGGTKQSLEVGSAAMFGRQTYVRLPGTRDVILASGDLANWVPRNADDWRDLRLVPEDLEFDRLRFWGQSRTVELAKGGDAAWRMELPVDSAADQMVIRQLIQRMQLARIVQVAAAAGEGEPAATVRLARGDDTVIELEFRKPNDEEPTVLVKHSERGTVVIQNDGLLTLLRLPHDQFREHAIFRRPLGEVTSVTVDTIRKFTVAKKPDGAWQVTEPKQFPADTILVNVMLTNLRNAQIVEFIKDDASAADFKKHGLANPWLNLEINGASVGGDRWRESIALGTVDTLRVAARANDEPVIVSLPREQAILLPKEAFKLRERRLWSFSTNQVAAVTMTLANKPTRFSRLPNATWRSADNEALDQIQSAMLEETVYRMGVLSAIGWVAEGKPAMEATGIKIGANQLTAEVDTADGPRQFRLELGNKGPLGRTRVMTDQYGTPTIFSAPNEFTNIYFAALQTLGLARL
ncbi:MAG: DUF4340 domain-containing protein [Verrucomicrobiota bacterium]|nr:DUF4340 domain-containing protein [Verrucomicrobiota bacterium]